MKQLKRYAATGLFSLIFLFSLTSCNSTPVPNYTNETNLTRCTEPRPQICTMEYQPVCAKLSDNSHKTYASACSACADRQVLGHTPQACPKSTE